MHPLYLALYFTRRTVIFSTHCVTFTIFTKTDKMAVNYDVLEALRLVTMQSLDNEASDSEGTSDEDDVPDKTEPISGDLEPAEVESELLNVPEFVSYLCNFSRNYYILPIYEKSNENKKQTGIFLLQQVKESHKPHVIYKFSPYRTFLAGGNESGTLKIAFLNDFHYVIL